MNLPRLYPILDTASLAERGVSLETAAAAFLEGGAGILQIRHKMHWSRDVFESARQVARLCREAGAPLIVNDRADFAMLLEAGLHVGQDDLAPRDARKLLGPGAVIGFSSHNVDQLSAAGGEPVDYVAFGPVFPTASKGNPDPVVGVEEISRCRALAASPWKMPSMSFAPAPIPWPSSPGCSPRLPRPVPCENGWNNGNCS